MQFVTESVAPDIIKVKCFYNSKTIDKNEVWKHTPNNYNDTEYTFMKKKIV